MMPEFDDNITRWTTYGWAITIKENYFCPIPSLNYDPHKNCNSLPGAEHRNILPEADPDINLPKRSLTPSSAGCPPTSKLGSRYCGSVTLSSPRASVTLGAFPCAYGGEVQRADGTDGHSHGELGVRGAEGAGLRG